MSEEQTPDRTIPALPARPRGAAASLLRTNRGPAGEPAPLVLEEQVAADPQQDHGEQSKIEDGSAGGGEVEKSPRAASVRSPGRLAGPATPPQAAGKEQVAALIDASVRRRARSAFRAAAFYEDVPSFAQLLENALVREIERLERDYNDGEPFEGTARNLAPGRPVTRT